MGESGDETSNDVNGGEVDVGWIEDGFENGCVAMKSVEGGDG